VGREALETLAGVKDLLESPSNGLLAVNGCMLQLLEDCEGEQQDVTHARARAHLLEDCKGEHGVGDHGVAIRGDGVEFERALLGRQALDLLMADLSCGMRGTGSTTAAPARELQWAQSSRSKDEEGKVRARLEEGSAAARRDEQSWRGTLSKSHDDGVRAEQLKAEVRALTNTRDELLTETEGLLGEVAALVERRAAEYREEVKRSAAERRGLAELELQWQVVRGRRDDARGVLAEMASEVGELVALASGVRDDVHVAVRGLMEMSAAHGAGVRCLESVRREHEHLLVEMRAVTAGVCEHASALRSCVQSWSEEGAQVCRDLREQAAVLEREVRAYELRLAGVRAEVDRYEGARTQLQEVVAGLKAEEASRSKSLRAVGAEVERLQQEKALGVSALAVTQQRQQQGEDALRQLQSEVGAQQAQLDELGHEMLKLHEVRSRVKTV
jgi:chromosome segregation ATPase